MLIFYGTSYVNCHIVYKKSIRLFLSLFGGKSDQKASLAKKKHIVIAFLKTFSTK